MPLMCHIYDDYFTSPVHSVLKILVHILGADRNNCKHFRSLLV